MLAKKGMRFIILTILVNAWLLQCYHVMDIRMPNVSPKGKETYLCTSKKLPRRGTQYAYKFVPNADQTTAHHMLIFACDRPASHKSYWECNGAPCAGEEQIIYAWAKNADKLALPKHVAFPIGKEMGLQYIVTQVHYARPLEENEFDASGVSVYLTTYEPQFFAGIYLFSNNNFKIPAHSKGYNVDTACHYNGPSMKPFAFRTHAHVHSRSISAYRIRNGQWSLIGIGNPQLPQAFYPIKKEDRLLIKDGDMLAARCTFDTLKENKIVTVGSFSGDEMCNFYMMYYTLSRNAEDSETPYGCFRNTKTLKFPEGSMLPFPTTPLIKFTHPAANTTAHATQSTDILPTQHVTIPSNVKETIHAKKTTPAKKTTHAKKTTEAPTKSTVADTLTPILDPKWSISKNIKTRLGNIGSIDVGADNNVVILHSGSRSFDYRSFDDEHFYLKQNPIKLDTLVVVDATDGSFMKSFGSNIFFLPYSLKIDQHGNYFITDLGLHQVFKFDPDKIDAPLLTLGVKGMPGKDHTHFCSPTDVITDKDDNIYVADGLCNNRIVKFDSQGKFIKEFGHDDVKHPRKLAIDGNHIYVSDRGSQIIHVFDHEGSHVTDLSHGMESGSISMIHCDSHGGMLYIISKSTGLLMKSGTGHVISKWKLTNPGVARLLAMSRDQRHIYVIQKEPIDLKRFEIPNDEKLKPKVTKVHPKFPWTEVRKTTPRPVVHNITSAKSGDQIPNGPYDNDDITVVPAVVVVAVLATPVILVLIALIIQHFRLKSRVNRAARKRTLDTYSKGGLCTCCCTTPSYYYDSRRGFDRLTKGYNENADSFSSGEEDEEEDLFTRKA